MIQPLQFEKGKRARASRKTTTTSAFKFGDWIVLEGINASYNPKTKQIIYNIMGEGFPELATKSIQEFLESLIPATSA